MKLFIPTCFLILILSTDYSHVFGQVAYYDALELSKYLDKEGKLITDDSTLANRDILKVDSLYGILKVYLPDSLRNRRGLSNKTILEYYFNNNPFIKQYLFKPELVALAGGAPSGKIRQLISTIGGLDVTNLALGITDFLIERSKEELTVTFFDRFKQDLNNYPELRTLFPATSSFLDEIASHEYGLMLQVLRKSFNNDFTNLSTRFRNLRDLSKEDCELASRKTECEKRIEAFENFFKKPESIYYVSATIIIDSLSIGSNAGNIIAAVANDKQIAQFPKSNLANAVKLTNLFSESLRSTDTTKVWISKSEIGILTKAENKNILNLYLGLIYQNSKTRQIGFTKSDGSFEEFASRLDSLVNNTGYLSNLINGAEELNAQVSEIKRKKREKIQFTPDDYFRYANTTISIIENFLHIRPVFGVAVPDEFKQYINVTRSSINLYYNIKGKEYSSAVFNTVVILEKALGKEFKYKDQVLKYGSFMAAVAEADSSDEIKEAIEAIALPAGSSRIKRETAFNVSLNGYLGPFAGGEALYELEDDKAAFSVGPFAPVGIGANFGIRPERDKPTRGGKSFSIFLSVIDVGAIAAFRIDEQKNSSSPNESVSDFPQIKLQNIISVSDFPQIKLQNIIAPGLFGILGLGKSPFSLGAGVQLGPTLRKITNPSNPNDNFYLRYSGFFTVDIPILNLYTRPRIRQD
jgi:hypothetical protein